MESERAAAAVGNMLKRPLALSVIVLVILVEAVIHTVGRRPFPPDTTPAGAYTRIAFAIAQRRPRDAFAYLQTEAQWAAHTIYASRKKASDRVRQSYPPDQRDAPLAQWKEVADAPDAEETFAILAKRHGWIVRLERDLSGVAKVEVQGERATIVTGRGTRYPFRRRDNGIWGLTIFTAELEAEAERATRDLEIVEKAAADYQRATAP